MKKIICLTLLCLFNITVDAKPFPTVKKYVIDGLVASGVLNETEMFRLFGEPKKRTDIKNECLETTERFVEYPSVTFKNGEIDKVFFINAKSQIVFTAMTVNAKTTVADLKKLGRTSVNREKGITSYFIQDIKTNDTWYFDFKAGSLYSAYLAIDDC